MAAEYTIKTVIFCVTYLCAFIAIIGLIPSDFYAQSKTYTQFDMPSYFSQDDVQHIKHFENASIHDAVPYSDNEWLDFNPDANFKFVARWYNDATGRYIRLLHVTWEFWWLWNGDYLECPDVAEYYGHSSIFKTDLQTAWDSNYNASIFYPFACEHITVKVWFADYNATRNNIGSAWDENHLNIAIGFGFDDYETKLSSWDVMGRLLTFQSPEIFGASGAIATTLNLIVGIPFWVAVAVCIYLLIMEVIPF